LCSLGKLVAPSKTPVLLPLETIPPPYSAQNSPLEPHTNGTTIPLSPSAFQPTNTTIAPSFTNGEFGFLALTAPGDKNIPAGSDCFSATPLFTIQFNSSAFDNCFIVANSISAHNFACPPCLITSANLWLSLSR